MHKNCFTLLEILIAIGIIAILAALTVGGLQFAGGKSDEAKTIAIMKEFEMALEKYKADKGLYPVVTSAAEVDFDSDEWKKFKAGKYMSGELSGKLLDGYDNAFWYKYPGDKNKGKYDLWSLGEDGNHGNSGKSDEDNASKAGEDGSDDICNWKQ